MASENNRGKILRWEKNRFARAKVSAILREEPRGSNRALGHGGGGPGPLTGKENGFPPGSEEERLTGRHRRTYVKHSEGEKAKGNGPAALGDHVDSLVYLEKSSFQEELLEEV